MIDLEKAKELTKKQQEIKKLFIEEKLSVTEISSRLQISKASVCKHLNLIKKKLGIGKGPNRIIFNRLTNSDSPPYSPPESFKNISVRLHGLHFLVIPYWKSGQYEQLLKQKQNVIPSFYGWRIELNRENIEIVSLETTDFIGNDRYEAFALAFKSLNQCILRLENRLKIGILKNDYMNMKMVKMHIAVMKDGIAQSVQDNKRVMLFNKEGEAWFSWDMSKNEPEWEAIHSIDAKIDYDLVKKYIGDWKDNGPPTNTELLQLITKLALGMAAPHIQAQEFSQALEAEKVIWKKDYIG